jgi:flagellar export protein FliJ
MGRELHTLIRLARFAVDDRKRLLAGLLRRAEAIAAEQAALSRQITAEQAVARAAPELAGSAYPGFAQAALRRRGQLAQAQEAVDAEIAGARERLAEAYRQARTLETAQQQRDQRRAAAAARLEQATLDAIGQQVHWQNRGRAAEHR